MSVELLRFGGPSEGAVTALRFDAHVPLAIEFGTAPATCWYWRAVDGQRGLLELGVDGERGTVRSLALVMLRAEAVKVVDAGPGLAPGEALGVPVVDTRPWTTRMADPAAPEYTETLLDEEVELGVELGPDWLAVTLGPARPAHLRAVTVGRVGFGLARDGRLLRVEVRRVDAAELAAFRSGCDLT